MKKIRDYQDLHLKWDVVFLADVFEKLRNKILKNNGLCPSHYSNASLNWDAMLSMTKVELEFICDGDMYLSFENVVRDRVSYISKRYSKVNIEYLKSYAPKHTSKYIIYLGANN